MKLRFDEARLKAAPGPPLEIVRGPAYPYARDSGTHKVTPCDLLGADRPRPRVGTSPDAERPAR